MDERSDRPRHGGTDDSDGAENVTQTAARYPLWLIVIGVVIFALVLLFLATMLLPGAATGPQT